jgi:hypothetical protein
VSSLSHGHELGVVRALAERVAAIAASERMQAIRRRWRDVNECRKPDRAPVWCRPVGCWSELLPDERIECRDPVLRGIEYSLRQILVKDEIGDDSIVNPWYDVQRSFDVDAEPAWGVAITRHHSTAAGGAWGYDPPIKTVKDVERLRPPTFRYNAEKSEAARNATENALRGILPVRLRTGSAFGLCLSATLGTMVADLLGLSDMMLLMATDPEIVHHVTKLVAEAVRASNLELQRQRLLDRNNDAPMTFSDDFGPPAAGDGRLSCANLWCAANSQEYDQVSPAMWREFCLDYQLPLMAEFGRVAYGCCENLTQKLDDVLRIPNLRVVVCSAWTRLDTLLAKCGPDLCIMWRQKASDVVMPPTLDGIRRDIDEGTRKLKGRSYQIVLRELQTLFGHPNRLKEWTRVAVEAAERHST